MHLKRRTFMHTLAATGTLGALGMARAKTVVPRIKIGLCSSMDKAEQLKAIGFDFIEGSVARTLKPEMPDAEYAPELEKIKACALPHRSCNGFIPGKFHLTGPETAHDAALDYAVKACQRADAAGIPYIVLGSGEARKVPEGFDLAKGKEQFIAFCQKLGARIKGCNVTIVLEPLNKGETNLLNSVAEGIDYVDAIGHPRIQLLADFYHMMKEDEGPDSIRKAGKRIFHCHIAELEGRKAPGTKGEDLSRFFKALTDIRYSGGVSCECGWPKENVEEAWKKALVTIRQQIGT